MHPAARRCWVTNCQPRRPLDLPRPRGSRTCNSSRLRPLCGTWRTASSALAPAGVASHSRSGVGRSHRVHGLDLPTHTTGEFVSNEGRRGRLQRRVHRALRSADFVPDRPDTIDAGTVGKYRSFAQYHGVRDSLDEIAESRLVSNPINYPEVHLRRGFLVALILATASSSGLFAQQPAASSTSPTDTTHPPPAQAARQSDSAVKANAGRAIDDRCSPPRCCR